MGHAHLSNGFGESWYNRASSQKRELPHPHLRHAAPLFAVQGGLRTALQRLEVPDHAFAIVAGELEILSEFEGIGGAGIFTEAAEHAAAQVVGKLDQLFAPGLFIALAGDDDQVLGTCDGA